MSTASVPSFTCYQTLRQVDPFVVRLESLKHRRSSFLRSTLCSEAYPSPPMSNPPSPPRPPPEENPVTSPAVQNTTSTSTTSPPGSSHMSGVAVAPAPLGPPFYEPIRQTSSISAPPSSTLPSEPAASSEASQSFPSGRLVTTPIASSSSAPRPSSSRGGRKSKAHVASACINCKRAHLSCDVNRPCARCVASGKQVWNYQCLGPLMLRTTSNAS